MTSKPRLSLVLTGTSIDTRGNTKKLGEGARRGMVLYVKLSRKCSNVQHVQHTHIHTSFSPTTFPSRPSPSLLTSFDRIYFLSILQVLSLTPTYHLFFQWVVSSGATIA